MGDQTADSNRRPWRRRPRGEGRATADSSIATVWLARAARGAVWAALAVGAVGGVRGLTVATAAAPAETAPTAPAPDVAAGGVAETLVGSWLAGEPLDGVADGLVTAITPMVVSRTATVSMEPSNEGWSVVVAATVAPTSDPLDDDLDTAVDPSQTSTRFYRVDVVDTAPPTIAALPAQIAPPPPAAAPSPTGGDATGDVPAGARPELLPPDVVDTLEGFAAGLLTGTGSLDRYLTTDSDVTAIDPAPFVRIEIATAVVVEAADDTATIRIDVVGFDGDDNTVHQMSYQLQLRRGDRWEVAAVL